MDISNLSDEELDRLVKEKLSKKVNFKNNSVKDEFSKVDPFLAKDAESSPYALTVTSGKRSTIENNIVGGKQSSKHLTGNALDLRKDGNSPETENYFKNKGYKVIDEGDHLHVQGEGVDDSRLNELVREKLLKMQGKEAPEEKKTPLTDLEQMFDPFSSSREGQAKSGNDIINAVKSGAVGAARMLPGSDMSQALLDTLSGKGNFSENLQKAKETGKYYEDLSPTASAVGKGLVAVPAYMSGMEALGAGQEAMKFAPEIAGRTPEIVAKGTSLLGDMLRGGTVNAAIGQSERGLQDNPQASALEFLLGAAGEGIPKGINFAADKVQNIGEMIKENLPLVANKVGRTAESIPVYGKYHQAAREAEEAALAKGFENTEALRKAEYKSGVAELKDQFRTQEKGQIRYYNKARSDAQAALENFAQKGSQEAGDQLAGAVKEMKSQMSNEWRKSVNPVIRKYSKTTVSPEGLRQDIVAIFDEAGLTDGKGNILKGALKKIQAPEMKSFYQKLANYSSRLLKNPTINEINLIKSELDSLGSNPMTKEGFLYSKLASSAKNTLLDGLEQVGKESEIQGLRAARKSYAEGKSIEDEIGKLTNKFGEQVQSGFKSKSPGSFISDAVKKKPILRQSFADSVMTDISSRAKTPQQIDDLVEYYGGEKNLKDLIGEQNFSKLVKIRNDLESSLKPRERALAPQPIPYKKGTPPQYVPKTTAKYLRKAQPIIEKAGVALKKGGRVSSKASRVIVPSITSLEDLLGVQ